MPFTPGNTINTGRKKSIAKQFMKELGVELDIIISREDSLKIMQAIMSCNLSQLADIENNENCPVSILTFISSIRADIKHGRTQTLEMLWDKVYGKNVQSVMVTTNTDLPLNEGQRITREQYLKLKERMV